MSQFIVSARKYRPVTFDSVVGQKHIAETLKNAIKSGHLAQAFLFSGPRGVGKTTCARILAKTINCTNRNEKIEACDGCQSCESFNEGHSLNIYELDAASNNSVEDIRLLIDQVRFAPQIGSKKVYIIDEVHMLSTQAFNAFLKTLEEPPAHAIFILATTEKHKIIPTILSRCQVFDFNRIEMVEMIRHLEAISKRENVMAEHDALHLIAQKSDGSLRDALSMFDQMVTYSGDELTYKAVVDNLSILSADYFFALTDFLVTSDISSALLLYNEVLQKGFDGHNFLLSFSEHLRNLLVSQDHSTIELLTVGEQLKEKFRDQTLRVSSDFLIKSLNLVSKSDVSYKNAKNQRLLVELTLINIAHLNSGLSQRAVQKSSIPTNNAVVAEDKKKQDLSPKSERDQVLKQSPIEIEDRTPQMSSKKDTADSAQTAAPKPEASESIPTSEKHVTDVEAKTLEVETKTLEVEKKESNPKSKSHEEIIEKRSESPVEPPKLEVTEKGSPEKLKKRRYDPSIMSDTISISGFTTDSKESIKNADQGELMQKRNSQFDQNELEKAWGVMVKKYEGISSLSLHSTLSKYKPKLIGDNEVEFTYDNKAQLEAIRDEKQQILESLRNGLGNDNVILTPVLSDEIYQRPYTQAEKLQKLIEKNPSINTLKNKLDLDIGQ
ncbi:MAG: DNA polymerase III subunit gamma/tau [Vicingaceae bacterium]